MSSFSVVLGYKFDDQDYQAITLDTINSTTVSGSASITDQPMASGEVIADHMYDEPKTMSISGVLSLNGSQVTQITGEGSKLANFQSLIENIQKNGVKCDIIRLGYNSDDSNIRFLYRQNMVVQSFNWTENINSLSYNISFKEAISVKVKDYDYDTDDEFVCNLTAPALRSFTDLNIDWSQIDTTVLKTLQSNGLLDNAFLNVLQSSGKDYLIGIVGTAVAAILVGLMIALNTTPIGWVLTAAAVVVGAVYFFARSMWNAITGAVKRRKFKILSFALNGIKDENIKKKTLKRFGILLEDIHNQFSALDNIMHIYQIGDDIDQTVMLTIGDENYDFKFTKNNLTHHYSLDIENDAQTNFGGYKDITSAPVSIDTLQRTQRIIQAENNADVFLVYIPTIEEENGKEQNEDLRNYYIIVADFNVDDFNKIIEDIVRSSIEADYKKKWSGWLTL